jgi:hypothetical protein
VCGVIPVGERSHLVGIHCREDSSSLHGRIRRIGCKDLWEGLGQPGGMGRANEWPGYNGENEDRFEHMWEWEHRV